MSAGKKIIWFPDEIVFLKQNYQQMSNNEMLKHINSNRLIKICAHSLRAKRYELGLFKSIKNETWNKRETDYLLKNFNTIGNIEMALYLNSFGDKSRNFDKKTIEKKMVIMNLHRTDDELNTIRQNHVKRGAYPGRVGAMAIGSIFHRDHCGQKYWFKKTGETKFSLLHRIIWEENFGKIPEGHKIYFKDGNQLNIKPENLECLPACGVKYKQRRLKAFEKKAIPVLQEEGKQEYFVRVF